MSSLKPTQILTEEHRLILTVLDAVEIVASRGSGDWPADFFAKAVDFFASFADQFHHAKEEAILFPALEQRGMPREGGPVGRMLHEHEQGRAHVSAIRNALDRAARGDGDARRTVRQEALAYVTLLRQHIFKEDNVLFRMADHLLPEREQERLGKEFERTESQTVPSGTREKYVAMAAELCAAADSTKGVTQDVLQSM
jgi:hemerythrin-like domain-containing protein